MENDLPASSPAPSNRPSDAAGPRSSGEEERSPRRPPRRRGPREGEPPRPGGEGENSSAPATATASSSAGDRPPRRSREGGGSGEPRRDGPPRRGGSGSAGRGERGGPGGRRGGGGERKERPEQAAAPAREATIATTTAQDTADREHLGGPLLAAVSRSFSLSINLLPEPLRGPISLGYLLARALDTIADGADAAPVEARLGHLRAVLEMLKYGPDPAALRVIAKDLAPRQTHAGERELLTKLAPLLAWYESLEGADRWDLGRTLARIGYGQELDLRRFGGGKPEEPAGEVRALATAAETQEYAYLVAGSAGEFWTRLCERHLSGYAKLPGEEMLARGKRLGQGLQLVNILRDLPRDLAAGRCYLPAEDLAADGLTADDLVKEPARARPLLAKWRAATVDHLDAGWQYVQAIRASKLRYAVALPALLAVRTLEKLAKTSPLETDVPVKVDRATLKRLMLTSAAANLLAPPLLDRLYRGPRDKARAA